MNKFTANYCKSNSNFIITNLPSAQIITPYTNIVRIVQNLIMRGSPTIASKFIRDELCLNRNYLEKLSEVKFISTENLDWSRTIKGDISRNDYPAEQLYNDLEIIFNRLKFLKNLTIAEYPISNILSGVQVFNKQSVDFYIPLLKTVIEVDGEGHKRQLVLDRKRDSAFKRNGINVVRISTKDIRAKNYENLKKELRNIYYQNKEKVEKYWNYLRVNVEDYDVQIKLTAIVRLQVLILELLDRGVIALDDRNWKFNVTGVDVKTLELALKDLEKWIGHISALFNTTINLPNINIMVYDEQSQLPTNNNDINININIFKRWDDSVNQKNVYFIRTDFDDEANYFSLKINEPVVYSLSLENHKKNLEFLLENLFGHNKFNDGQLEIIINCLNGKDTIGLLPTGGGKSLTYQLCVLLQPAISFVVVPIKALMIDQINNMKRKHYITHASYINSDLSPVESSKRLKDFSKGKYIFIIISPERFQSKSFRKELALVNETKAVSIAVIDEVHCLSEWGHDFRTSYLALSNSIKKLTPSSRFLALTATASSKVLKDIMTELEIDSRNVITISNFTRKELEFNVVKVKTNSKQEYLMNLLGSKINSNNKIDGPTLIFTQSVNGNYGCYKLSHGIHARTGLRTGYFSGKTPDNHDASEYSKYKERIQDEFMNDEIDVLVATKAFGMGIDKGNIRETVHFGIPNSLESFYQEAGRAGRDKNKARCTILYSPDQLDDKQMQKIFGLNTNISVLKSEKNKMVGDLNTLLFYLTENLMDIGKEVEEIYSFYERYLEGKTFEVAIDFSGDKDRDRKEKCIYRLALLGIVDDWTIDWKSRQIIVERLDFTEESVINNLLSYIRKYDYMFSLNPEKQSLYPYGDIVSDYYNSDKPFLMRILSVLITWYNNNIIYSRKQSMLLMKQFADEFEDSESLHKKLEIYFKRNDDVYHIENTIAQKERLKDWYKIFYVHEEGKECYPRQLSTFKSLKITVSRFLESYNSDICLNLINGVISFVSNEFNTFDSKERMATAIREISRMDSNLRKEMLSSITSTAADFLNYSQRDQLCQLLILNGFDSIEDLRLIHINLEDRVSFSKLIKEIYSNFIKLSSGGYPWEI